MRALIDGDIALHAVGFAADRDQYDFAATADEFLNFIYKVVRDCGADDFIVCLTGEDNFRDKVAKTRKYKGNRDNKTKPVHFYALKDWVVSGQAFSDFDSVNLSMGEEADDVMGRLQIKDLDNSIICSLDKDLNQIPGWHYNWRQEKIYYVEQEEAIRFYYKQLLMGDPVDNIIGIDGLGPKKAEKLLEGKSLSEIETIVNEQYKEHYKDNWKEVLEEHKQLIGIKWF